MSYSFWRPQPWRPGVLAPSAPLATPLGGLLSFSSPLSDCRTLATLSRRDPLLLLLLFFTRGRYDPSGGIIVIITIIMCGRSGLVLCGQKCALKSNKIETLNADGKPLEEKRAFTFITSG